MLPEVCAEYYRNIDEGKSLCENNEEWDPIGTKASQGCLSYV